MKRKLLQLFLILGLAVGLRAQTAPAPADVLENAWHVNITGGYSLTAGNGTNNGFATSLAVRVAQHWNARADIFTIASPATIVTLVGPEYRFSLAHVLASSQFINTQNFAPFLNVKMGDAKSPGASKFAYAIGGGIDYVVNSTLTLRPLDVTYIRASIFQSGGIVVGNHVQLASSIGLTF